MRWRSSSPETARWRSRRSGGCGPAVPFGYHETLAAGTWNLISIETGENIEEADAYVTGLLRDAVRVDDHEAAAIAAFGLATTEFLRGRYRSSARWWDECELHYEHGDTFTAMTVVLAYRVGIAAATGGDVEAALERMRARFGPARRVAPPDALRPARRRLGGRVPRRGRALPARRRGERPDPDLRRATALRGLPRGRGRTRTDARGRAPRRRPPRPRLQFATSPPATAPNCSPSPTSSPRSAPCATGWRPRSAPPTPTSAPVTATAPAAPPPAHASCISPTRALPSRPSRIWTRATSP